MTTMEKIEGILKNAGVADRLTLIKIRYAIEILKNEVVKLIILVVLFSLLGYQKEFFVAVAILLPIRTFSGGMHMKSNVGCFFYSLIFFLLAVIALPMVKISLELMFLLLTLSAILIVAISPVASYKRPIKTDTRRTSMKKKTLVTLTVDCAAVILLLHLGIQSYFIIGVWVVMLQAIQLFATWIFRKVKGVRNVGKNQEMAFATVVGIGD